jgi:hypothetical protein
MYFSQDFVKTVIADRERDIAMVELENAATHDPDAPRLHERVLAAAHLLTAWLWFTATARRRLRGSAA